MSEPYDPAKRAKKRENKKQKRKKAEKKKKKIQDQIKQRDQLRKSRIKSKKKEIYNKEDARVDGERELVDKDKKKKKPLYKSFDKRLEYWQDPTKKQHRKKRSTMEKKLWRVFSKFIRKRDCLRTTWTEKYCRCITCWKIYPDWESKLNAGHYIKRGKKIVKFNEKNVHWQCVSCNKFRDWEQDIHREAIDILYGEGTAEKIADKKWKVRYFSIMELKDLIKQYRKKYKELSKENIDTEKREKKYNEISKKVRNLKY